MAPQPVHQDNVIGGLRPASQPVRKTSQGELDEERKQELIMEKKLRACRVSILPKGASYFEQPKKVLPPPPKKPPPPAISVEAVKKATNPIALRYWNQCSNTTTEREETPVKVVHATPSAEEKPPWVTSSEPAPPPHRAVEEQKPKLPPKKVSVPNIVGRMGRAGSVEPGAAVSGPRQRVQSLDRGRLQPPIVVHHDDPSPMGSPRTEVVKVLSTAGTGINRENEKKEAVGNINRLFSMAKIKKDDAARVNSAKQRAPETSEEKANQAFEESRSYQRLKEEQIQKSQQRANFMGGSEQIRIPKSPRPFRDSSPKTKPLEESPCSCRKTPGGKFTSTEIPFNTVTDLIPKLNQQQATHIGLSLFNQMTQDTVMEVLAQQLNTMSGQQMTAVFGGLRNQALNTALPLLLPKANEDVKMSIVVDSLPRISTSQKLDMLQETDEEIPVLIEGLMQRLGYNERRQVVKSILDREENSGRGAEQKTAAGARIVPEARDPRYDIPEIRDARSGIPEIRLDSAGEQEEQEEIWAWEEGEEMEYEFLEQEEGAVSN